MDRQVLVTQERVGIGGEIAPGVQALVAHAVERLSVTDHEGLPRVVVGLVPVSGMRDDERFINRHRDGSRRWSGQPTHRVPRT